MVALVMKVAVKEVIKSCSSKPTYKAAIYHEVFCHKYSNVCTFNTRDLYKVYVHSRYLCSLT